MKNTAIEKLSYTEVTKNISQAEYNQTQIRSAFSASDRDLHHSPYRNNM